MLKSLIKTDSMMKKPFFTTPRLVCVSSTIWKSWMLSWIRDNLSFQARISQLTPFIHRARNFPQRSRIVTLSRTVKRQFNFCLSCQGFWITKTLSTCFFSGPSRNRQHRESFRNFLHTQDLLINIEIKYSHSKRRTGSFRKRLSISRSKLKRGRRRWETYLN